ncbi:hypothetical protein FOZ62_010710, partial [Perkinsus olseni]
MSGLDCLPDELLYEIFRCLGRSRKTRCRQPLGLTCNRFEVLERSLYGNTLKFLGGGKDPYLSEFLVRTFRRRRGVGRLVTTGFTGLLPEMLTRMSQLPSSDYYKHLTEVTLTGCNKLNATSLNTFIKKCPSLARLGLFDIPAATANLTFNCIREACKNLKIIRVGAHDCKFTSRMSKNGLSNITMPLRDSPSCLEEIILLRLDMAKIGQCGLDMIADRLQASLLRLDLSNPKGECPSVESLGKLSRLEGLRLAGWSFSSEALTSALASLKELKLLDLSESSIDDAG